MSTPKDESDHKHNVEEPKNRSLDLGRLTPPIYAHMCRLVAGPRQRTSPSASAAAADQPLSSSARRTLSALMRVNKQLHDIASPYLYRDITLTTDNAAGLFEGLQMAPTPSIGPFGRGKYKAVERVQEPMRLEVRKAASRGLKAKSKRIEVKAAKWPEESADSDEGEEDEVEDGEAVGAGSGEQNAVVGVAGTEEETYPDAASHQRKLKLLGYVRHLTIASIPVTRYAMRIVYTFLHPRGTPPEVERTATVFKNCTHLRMSGRASWALAEWSNRHRSRSHPFTRALLDMVKPKHLIDRSSGPESADNLQDVKSRWWSFAHWYNQIALSNLVQMWELESMNVHGVVDAYVPPSSLDRVKVWYQACPCSVPYPSNVIGDLAESYRRRSGLGDQEGLRGGDKGIKGAMPNRDGLLNNTQDDKANTDEIEDDADQHLDPAGVDSDSESSSSATSHTSILPDGIEPQTCDQHLTLESRCHKIRAMLGGEGSRLKRSQGESVDKVERWESVDVWRTSDSHQWVNDDIRGADVERSEQKFAGSADAQVKRWMDQVLRSVSGTPGSEKQDEKAPVDDAQERVAKGVLSRVELPHRSEADCCDICGGK